MHALSPEQYARLGQLAEGWTRRYLRDAKREPGYNPRLAADALCFQRHVDGELGHQLVGALVTPTSLWLVAVPADAPGPAPEPGGTVWLRLPSGEYPLEAVALGEALWCRRLVLLDDLSDVTSRQAASRLAQRLMERVMAGGLPDGGSA